MGDQLQVYPNQTSYQLYVNYLGTVDGVLRGQVYTLQRGVDAPMGKQNPPTPHHPYGGMAQWVVFGGHTVPRWSVVTPTRGDFEVWLLIGRWVIF
jgi:hypothetical protein